MTRCHSANCRERQRIGKRALVIHLATNRYLSQHIQTFWYYQRYYYKQTGGSLGSGCNHGEDADENDINLNFFTVVIVVALDTSNELKGYNLLHIFSSHSLPLHHNGLYSTVRMF